MKIITEVKLNEEEIYNAGREAGLNGSDLDGFAISASYITLEFDYDSDKAEMVGVIVK